VGVEAGNFGLQRRDPSVELVPQEQRHPQRRQRRGVVVDVVAGPNQGTWTNDGWKECYLTADDDGRTLVFSVSASNGFKLNMVSTNCSTTLARASVG